MIKYSIGGKIVEVQEVSSDGVVTAKQFEFASIVKNGLNYECSLCKEHFSTANLTACLKCNTPFENEISFDEPKEEVQTNKSSKVGTALKK